MITLPAGFTERYRAQFGSTELHALQAALQKPLSSAIHLQPEVDISTELRKVPWSSRGYYTDQDATFGADPLWYAGLYYVQEPAAMFIEQFISQLALCPTTALDLCAAPGGKSTLLRSLLPPETLLIANEPESKRAKILAENLLRWGLEETIITSTYPHQLLCAGVTFDLILVDAPCSGEGMFRKEPQALTEWSEDNVTHCVQRQQEILDAAWKMLQPGGTLIYSTCTLNLEENEEQLAYLEDQYQAHIREITIKPEWGIQQKVPGVYRFAPHHTESEGLTLFAVQKESIHSTDIPHRTPSSYSPSTLPRRKEKRQQTTQLPALPSELRIQKSEMLQAYRSKQSQSVQAYLLSPQGEVYRNLLEQARIPILSSGIPLGETKGKDFIPHTALALSQSHQLELHYPTLELTPSEALAYLRGEALSIPHAPLGFILLSFRSIPLGFAKALPNRINNLYPKELRLRSQSFTPSDIPTLF